MMSADARLASVGLGMTEFLPDKDISPITFTVLGILAEGALSEADLIDEMFKSGWKQNAKRPGHTLFVGLEQRGFILSTPAPKVLRFYQLTSTGFAYWKSFYEFCSAAALRWSHISKSKSPDEFVTLATVSPAAKRVKKFQRPPTTAEQKIILNNADPDFRRIYEFALHTRSRIIDLQNTLIEKIDWADKFMRFETHAESGRMIDVIGTKFNERAEAILKEAVGDRSSGEIFLRGIHKRLPWKSELLSVTFKNIIRKAGLDEEIGMSGRGGKLSLLAADEFGKNQNQGEDDEYEDGTEEDQQEFSLEE